jgi:hypothetical protein
MRRKYRLRSMLVALLLLSCWQVGWQVSYGPAMAQQKPPAGEKQKSGADVKPNDALSDGTFRLLWSKLNVDFRSVVTGAPYSAIAVMEHTQTLSDGNQIIRKSASAYYRDSEGRIRTEQKLDYLGNWTATGNAPQVIMIADPVAQQSYALDPVNRTGRVASYAAAPAAPKKPQESKEGATAATAKPPVKAAPSRLAAEAQIIARNATDLETQLKQLTLPKALLDERTKQESLGKQVIEGVEVEGTRTTRTIPAGEIGNTRPIQIVDESWYSSELHLRIMIVHRDPRSGESTFRLTNINRGEPARTLFEVPPDYRLAGNLASP